ncbi:hypothetical protein OIU77_023614 [Salix suchowensis]|uniref:Uncharacterized protein n=1 Tax=Salix suchowensis TaxID=1278906 RepID=A0ABQ9C8R6_9ROSI|nr:hypothetical protein OIU77_023614 [Salix suchowensis]
MARSPALQPGGPHFLAGLPLLITLTETAVPVAQATTCPIRNPGYRGRIRNQVDPRSRFALGSFTEEKAKQLRRKTLEGSTFHDIMYHSAIASRLALDGSGRPENLTGPPAGK